MPRTSRRAAAAVGAIAVAALATAPAADAAPAARHLVERPTRLTIRIPGTLTDEQLAELRSELPPGASVRVVPSDVPRVSIDTVVRRGRTLVATDRIDCELVDVRRPCAGAMAFTGRGGFRSGTVRYRGTGELSDAGYAGYVITGGSAAYRGARGRVISRYEVVDDDEPAAGSAAVRAQGIEVRILGVGRPNPVSVHLR